MCGALCDAVCEAVCETVKNVVQSILYNAYLCVHSSVEVVVHHVLDPSSSHRTNTEILSDPHHVHHRYLSGF